MRSSVFQNNGINIHIYTANKTPIIEKLARVETDFFGIRWGKVSSPKGSKQYSRSYNGKAREYCLRRDLFLILCVVFFVFF